MEKKEKMSITKHDALQANANNLISTQPIFTCFFI